MVLGYATRRELDTLTDRLNVMDTAGTRGMAAVQVQVTELVKDVTELKVRLEAHENRHITEVKQRADERRESRRYAITTAIAAVGALVGVLALLLVHLAA